LLAGFVVTLQLAVVSCAVSLLIASIVAVLSIAPSPMLRRGGRVYVDIFRSIPILAFLILLYYGLGRLTVQFNISAFWIAVAALSIIESAYLAEILRAALLSISAKQWEAGKSLGLGWVAILRLVVAPQAIPAALPGTTNMLIVILKDTALASLIAVNEVTLAATGLVGIYFQPIPVFIAVGILFVLAVAPMTYVAGHIERVTAKAMGIR
jgi:His/Glu/Gln/Arg/opine family amino acid ABC transporter permease subunit